MIEEINKHWFAHKPEKDRQSGFDYFKAGFEKGVESSICPHVITSKGGSSYCNLAESSVSKLQARLDAAEKVVELAKHYYLHSKAVNNSPQLATNLDQAFVAHDAIVMK